MRLPYIMLPKTKIIVATAWGIMRCQLGTVVAWASRVKRLAGDPRPPASEFLDVGGDWRVSGPKREDRGSGKWRVAGAS